MSESKSKGIKEFIELKTTATSEIELKQLARETGLLELSLEELKNLAGFLKINLKGKSSKKDIAQTIASKHSESFVVGKPVGYMTLNVGVAGFKAGIAYPVDKEREHFFLKTKVFKK
jgi:hypothetical protein